MSSEPLVQPPRFIPTLTQVVQPGAAPQNSLPELSREMREELVMRVMQRLDVALERRLPAAISQLVLTHMQALGPRLWEEVGTVVHEAVTQAVAQELESRAAPTVQEPPRAGPR